VKGVVINCIEELVTTQFGQRKWQEVLNEAGLDPARVFLAITDVAEDDTMRLIQAVGKTLNLSLQQVADAFGDYWVNVYAPRIYHGYYEKAKTAKDFLLQIDHVHIQMTKQLKEARPPRFRYEWEDAKTLIMHYHSHRGLMPIMFGLIKGVAKYFQEDLQITKLDDTRVRIIFPY